MEKIYAYSNKAGRHTVNSGKYLYLFLRTVVVAAISLAAVMILNLFCYGILAGMTHLAFLMLVCGLDYTCIWIFRWHLNIDAPIKNTVGTKMIWAITGIGSLKSVENLI